MTQGFMDLAAHVEYLPQPAKASAYRAHKRRSQSSRRFVEKTVPRSSGSRGVVVLLSGSLNRRKTRARGTLASRGSRADPHYHIVTTFEAKESGAPGVLAQSLGISGRLEWLSVGREERYVVLCGVV
jgi:hypothetical protein